jgi:hypothetical protein
MPDNIPEINDTPENWIDFATAMNEAGMKRGTFAYYIKINRVRRKSGRTERDTRYYWPDVIRLKTGRRDRKKTRPFLIDWMTITDLPDAIKLDLQVYEEATIGDFNLYRSWLKKNPHIAVCAFDRGDRRNIWAYIALLPLREALILEILSGKKTENDITSDDILTDSDAGPRSLLAISVVALPEHRVLLYFVLDHLMQHFVTLYPGVAINRIYAQAASPEGDVLMQKFHFSDIYVPYGNSLKHINDAYVLNLERPGASRTIREYQKRLEAKRVDLLLSKQESQPIPDLPASLISTQGIEAPSMSPAAARRHSSSTAKRQPSQKTELPSTLEALTPFLIRHGLRTSHIKNIEQYTAAGDWKLGAASVKHAVDAAGQEKILQDYRGHKGFSTCDVDNCPCHQLQSSKQ